MVNVNMFTDVLGLDCACLPNRQAQSDKELPLRTQSRSNYFLLLLFFLFSIFTVNSQELNALVSVNSDQISGSNKQVFKTLEKSIGEFLNQTKWTNRTVENHEKIDCAFTIIINKQSSSNRFEASIQVQSTRRVYGSTYATPILNIKDTDFSFKYSEFDPLIYNPTSFDSNLVSTIVFYVQIILGLDADTFQKYGGISHLKEAEKIMLQAQQSGISAWTNQVGKKNRFLLIDNLLSPKLKSFRISFYNYHRKGLDNFSKNKKQGKQSLEDALISLQNIHNKTIGNYLIRLFFDAKSDEIVNVYSDASNTRKEQQLINVLRKISPNNNSKWRKIN